MANEPAASAPPSATSAAKPITLAQLNQELQSAPPQRETPKAEPVAPPVNAPEPKKDPQPGDDAMKSMKEGLRKRVMEPKEEKAEKAEKKEEPKPEAKKEESKPEPKPEPAKDVEVPDDHLKVLPHDKPDTARRISKFLANEKRLKDEAAALKAELDAAKKATPTQANTDEVARIKDEYAKAQEDLLRYRRRYDIENDKDFAAKYREPVKNTETEIEARLKSAGLGDGTIKAIQAEGGFAKFSRSTKTFTVHEPDPDNEGQTRPVQRTAAQLARAWLDGIAVADAEFVKSAVGRQQLLQSEEQAAIQRAQDEAKTYFETQTKAQREAAEQAAATAKKQGEDYEKWVAETEKSTDFLKDREIPANATAEQKKEAEEYNEFNKQLRASLRNHPKNTEEYTRLKLDAIEAHHLRRTMGSKDAEIARLQEQLKKTQGAMRTTPKGGSILTGGKSDEPKAKESGDPMTDLKSRLRARIQGQTSADE